MVNLSQLQKALQLYEDSNELLPGYVNELGMEDFDKSNASWVVLILPFLEQSALWDEWNNPAQFGGPVVQMEIIVCPSNPLFSSDVASLSYAVNAGNIGNEPEDTCDDRKERRGNGMFFDRSRFEKDQRDLDEDCSSSPDSLINMSLAYVQSGDGMTATMMISETLRTAPWAGPGISTIDRKWHYGFCWEQPDEVGRGIMSDDGRQFFRINGIKEPSEYSRIIDKKRADAFPSSHHPGGVNVAFEGGSVKSINENISLMIYAQLMTTNRKQSELFKLANNGDKIPEKKLPQPNDSQY